MQARKQSIKLEHLPISLVSLEFLNLIETGIYIPESKVFTLNIYLAYAVAHTIDCDISKMLNHGLNHVFFLSLFNKVSISIET